jgi:uncharacterized protein (DUF1697 family)
MSEQRSPELVRKARDATTRRVALLRGINVGRAKRVAMADLRALLEEMGYGEVRTLLNSGNAVFTVPDDATGDPAPAIQRAIESRLGVSCAVSVFTAAEVAAAVEANPLLDRATNPSRLLVAFLRDAEGTRRLEPLAERDWGPDALALGPRVAYLWCGGGILESPLPEAVGRALGEAVTTRNWATVLKIHALLEDAG